MHTRILAIFGMHCCMQCKTQNTWKSEKERRTKAENMKWKDDCDELAEGKKSLYENAHQNHS